MNILEYFYYKIKFYCCFIFYSSFKIHQTDKPLNLVVLLEFSSIDQIYLYSLIFFFFFLPPQVPLPTGRTMGYSWNKRDLQKDGERERGTHRYFTSRPKAQTRWLNRRRRGRKFSSHTVVMDVVRGGGGNQGGGLKGLKWRKTRQESQSKQRGPIRANLFLFLFPSFPFVFRIILVPAHKRIQTARRPRPLTENALNFTAVFDACCRSS